MSKILFIQHALLDDLCNFHPGVFIHLTIFVGILQKKSYKYTVFPSMSDKRSSKIFVSPEWIQKQDSGSGLVETTYKYHTTHCLEFCGRQFNKVLRRGHPVGILFDTYLWTKRHNFYYATLWMRTDFSASEAWASLKAESHHSAEEANCSCFYPESHFLGSQS